MEVYDWLDWELEVSPHAYKRMVDRNFSETDLRTMLESPGNIRKALYEGRFVIETTYEGNEWEIVVEPDELDQILVVVTAFIPD